MRMPSRGAVYGMAAVVVAAITVLAVFYIVEYGLESEPKHPPTVESWSIQSGTRYPILWVNITDPGRDLSSMEVTLLNLTTRSIEGDRSSAFGDHQYAASQNITRELNCTNMPAGSYYVRLVVLDRAGGKSNVSDKVIELPDNTPPLPEIVGEPWTSFNATGSTWHFIVNATDGDGDGLGIIVVIYENDTWKSVYNRTFPNEHNLTSWCAEDDVSLPHGEYMIKAGAWDKAGWQSLSVVSYFDYSY